MNDTLPPPTIPVTAPSDPPPTTPSTAELVRPRAGRRIGGVCAAFADRHGWSRTTVRLVVALSILLPGPQVIAYLIAWLVIPSGGDVKGRSSAARYA